MAALFMGVSAVGCHDTVSDRDVRQLPLAEVRRLADKESGKTLFLDVRRPSLYAAGHIPGAVNVPAEGIEAEKEKLPPQLASPKTVVVYGENPGDSYAMAIAKRLLRAGQGGARLFAGGIAEWTRAGLPLEKSPGAAPQ